MHKDKYNGMCGDAEGNFYVDFVINGKIKEIFVQEYIIRTLAEMIDGDTEKLPTDGCAEIVDDDIRHHINKYVKYFKLR